MNDAVANMVFRRRVNFHTGGMKMMEPRHSPSADHLQIEVAP